MHYQSYFESFANWKLCNLNNQTCLFYLILLSIQLLISYSSCHCFHRFKPEYLSLGNKTSKNAYGHEIVWGTSQYLTPSPNKLDTPSIGTVQHRHWILVVHTDGQSTRLTTDEAERKHTEENRLESKFASAGRERQVRQPRCRQNMEILSPDWEEPEKFRKQVISQIVALVYYDSARSLEQVGRYVQNGGGIGIMIKANKIEQVEPEQCGR